MALAMCSSCLEGDFLLSPHLVPIILKECLLDQIYVHVRPVILWIVISLLTGDFQQFI